MCVWFSFAHYSCKNISINLNWMLCNEMKRMQNFKQSNDLSILHRCLCWICLSIAHCFLVSFAFGKWMKKKSKSLNWSKRQTRAFHTKEICHIHRYISFYCSVFLFLVLFSPIEFFLVGDFISSLVFLCNAQFNKPLWVDELCHYLLRFAASDCLRLCACVCLFIRSIIYALKPDTLYLLAVVTFFSLFSK